MKYSLDDLKKRKKDARKKQANLSFEEKIKIMDELREHAEFMKKQQIDKTTF